MSLSKAVCPSGELGNGGIKKPGNGTTYTSASAAQRAIERYKGPEVFTVKPAGALSNDSTATEPAPVTAKKRGGTRIGAGRQAESGEAVIRKNLSVSQVDIETLVKYGDGEFSRGVHRAAELVRKQAARKPTKSCLNI